MTTQDVILVGWGILAAGLIVWIWRQVRKSDDALEANEALQSEMRRFNAAHSPYTIPLPKADVDDEYYAAHQCDPTEHPHPRTPPKAA